MTKEEKDTIKNHFTEIPKNMEVFKSLIDVNIPDADKKRYFLAMIDKMQAECEEVKDIINNLPE